MSTDPTTLARETLEREEHLSAYTYSIPLAAQAAWDSTRSEQVRAAPDLARAVIELTAERDAYREKIARVEALAEKHETTAQNMGPGSYGGALAAKIAQEIRTALNGSDG